MMHTLIGPCNAAIFSVQSGVIYGSEYNLNNTGPAWRIVQRPEQPPYPTSLLLQRNGMLCGMMTTCRQVDLPMVDHRVTYEGKNVAGIILVMPVYDDICLRSSVYDA